MLTYLEICENIKSYGVGTKFEKYEFVNGGYVARNQYIIVSQVQLCNSNNNLYDGKQLSWESKDYLKFNEEMLNFKFKRVEEYVEIQPWEAIKLLQEDSITEVFSDYCGEKVLVELTDDFKFKWDIESVGDLVNRTRFYKFK